MSHVRMVLFMTILIVRPDLLVKYILMSDLVLQILKIAVHMHDDDRRYPICLQIVMLRYLPRLVLSSLYIVIMVVFWTIQDIRLYSIARASILLLPLVKTLLDKVVDLLHLELRHYILYDYTTTNELHFPNPLDQFLCFVVLVASNDDLISFDDQ